MKIKARSMIEGGMSVEDTIEALSKYVGMGAKIDIGQGGYDDIYLTFLKEETGPEKSIRIRRERATEVARQAMVVHTISVGSLDGFSVGNRIDIDGYLYKDGTTFEITELTPKSASTSGENEIKIKPYRLG